MYILQDCFIAFFGFTYRYTGKIPITVRNAISLGCVFLLTSEFYLLMVVNLTGLTDFTVRKLTFLGNILLIILAVMSVKGQLHRIKWNKWIVYPYLFAAIYMLFASFHHYPGRSYDTFPIQLLFIFPAIYFVWGNRGSRRLYYDWLAKSSMTIGVLLVTATIIFAPIGENTVVSAQYYGLTDNPNLLAMLLMISLAGTLYMMRPGKKLAPFYAVIAGISMAIILLSNSRGGIIVGVMEILAWITITLRQEFKAYGTKAVAMVAAGVLIIVLSIPVTNLMLDRSDYGDGEAGSVRSIEEIQDNTGSRFSVEGKDMNTFMSGRIEIWKWYIRQFNLLGHDCTNHTVQISEDSNVLHNAHNTYIEIAYRYGVPAGIGYALFMIALIVCLIRAALIRGRCSYILIISLFSLAYFIESLVDVMTLPFERGPVLMFYLALVGVFENDILSKAEKERVEDDSSRKSRIRHNRNELGENIPEHRRSNRIRRKGFFQACGFLKKNR